MIDAEVTSDLEKRAQMMLKAESLAMRDQPVIPIYHYVSKSLVSKKVEGYVDNPQHIHRWRYVSLK